VVHPEGEQPQVEPWSAIADTFAGRVHVEWDSKAPVTPLGRFAFFIAIIALTVGMAPIQPPP